MQRSCSFRKFFIIAVSYVFLLAAPVSAEIQPAPPMEEVYRHLETFSHVLSILQNNYVDEIDVDEVIQGAIKGMLSSLDPHSSYMKPDDFKELQVETKGSFTGIGVEITMRNGILTIVSPIEGTPAYVQGIKAGDKILKIEDESTKDMSLMDAVKKLRGPKGSKVTISLHREGWNDVKDYTLVRDVIPIYSVKSKFLEPGYAYVRITNFQSNTTEDMIKALSDMTRQEQIKGLILDLRNNPGGLLDQAVKMADLFLDEGIIVSTRGRLQDQNMTFSAHTYGASYDYPLIVLVNEGSASASEIVAGALQDHQRALILGAQTFGKGSVQTIIPMNNGAGLRLTTARYYTPKGTSIQATGISPDIIVPTVLAGEKEEGDEKRPHFIREKDLKHHIRNGNELEEGEPEGDIIEAPPEEEAPTLKEQETEEPSAPRPEQPEAEQDRERKELEQDNQLHTALLILKGLSVFSGMTN